ncbi:hypothetical protein QOT17_018395 [Balamuthia mandrillaris]
MRRGCAFCPAAALPSRRCSTMGGSGGLGLPLPRPWGVWCGPKGGGRASTTTTIMPLLRRPCPSPLASNQQTFLTSRPHHHRQQQQQRPSSSSSSNHNEEKEEEEKEEAKEEEEEKRKWYQFLRDNLAAVVVTVIGSIASVVYGPSVLKEHQTSRATAAILHGETRLQVPEAQWVPRPYYQGILRGYLHRPLEESNAYLVVMGTRGCGKSTMVQAAVRGREGVISVTLDGGDGCSEKEIVQRIAKEISRESGEEEVKHLVQLFQMAATARGKQLQRQKQRQTQGRASEQDDGEAEEAERRTWRPTIVVEITRGSEEFVKAVATTLKRLSCDFFTAHAIIVLGDANMVLGLPADRMRQQLLWVEDLTTEEALQFLDKRHRLMPLMANEREEGKEDKMVQVREKLLSRVGTRPASLNRALAEIRDGGGGEQANADLERFVEEQVRAARHEVAGLAANKNVPFERLMKEMLSRPAAEMPAEEAQDALGMPDFVEAVKQMGPHAALLYHVPSGCYRFQTPFHLRAAQLRYNHK